MPTEELPMVDEAATPSPTAGEILLQGRLRLGLDEKEVADRLHITMHYVKALETNAFEKLPGAVFAKGYLKSYAVLLGLDVAELTALYDEFASRQTAESEASKRQKTRRRSDRNKMWVVASIALFVLGFLGLWLYSSSNDTASAEESELGSVNVAPARTQPTQLDNARTALANEMAAAANSEEPAARGLTALEVPVVEFEELSADGESLAALGVQAAEAQPVQVTQELRLENLSEANSADVFALFTNAPASTIDISTASEIEGFPEETVAAASAAPDELFRISSTGSDLLRISFSGESWVEIDNSESEQVYRDIRDSGDILEVTGSAPFNILLGDAAFAALSLNGSEIDISDDIRIDNSARITVGP